MERTVILYHGSACPDGFGAAYAAWKKFGDTAEYYPLARGEELLLEVCKDAQVFFLDFSYEQEDMDKFVKVAAKLVVLDHHAGVKSVVESMPEFVFDNNRSGAGIAWDYFHPDISRPALMNHIEDDDIYRFALPDTKALITYLETLPFDFIVWDDLAKKLDEPTSREAILTKARAYREYFERLAELSVERAKLVSFEGHETYFASSPPLKSLKSLIGNQLAKKHGPLALVVSAHPLGYGISIRGDGSIDVAKIAQKYGGNGHASSAGFHISANAQLPWTLIEDEVH